MCTAIAWKASSHYFGRNLDWNQNFGETVTVTPRNYRFRFRSMPDLQTHYAMIGMAVVEDGYPLYFEATNEKGLSMAGLNFPDNACYKPPDGKKENIAPFELIPWILGQCAHVGEAEKRLKKINLVRVAFHPKWPLAPLHWMISDSQRSLTVEPLPDGLALSENPVGVLTNNPPFDFHRNNLSLYMNLTRESPVCRFSDRLELEPFSLGVGAMGLPGDASSSSRFVRAAFTKLNSVSGSSETESVSQFFHILGSAALSKGCVKTPDGSLEYTLYSCCCNTDTGVYYYTTYENSRIAAVDMRREDLDGNALTVFPLEKEPQIKRLN